MNENDKNGEKKMNNHRLEQYLAEADQSVKDFMAEVLETLGKQMLDGQEPRIMLHYFGAQFEVRLVSFDGDNHVLSLNDE